MNARVRFRYFSQLSRGAFVHVRLGAGAPSFMVILPLNGHVKSDRSDCRRLALSGSPRSIWLRPDSWRLTDFHDTSYLVLHAMMQVPK